jgi:hypothetical protein
MKTKRSKFRKRVELTLPPGDPGPICSYSPYCSPSDGDRNLAAWRKQNISLSENILIVTEDEEAELINTWILQLIRRELTLALVKAEKKLKRELKIDVGSQAAEIISLALKFRAPPHKHKAKGKSGA